MDQFVTDATAIWWLFELTVGYVVTSTTSSVYLGDCFVSALQGRVVARET